MGTPAQQANQVHELKDILVQEVSLVDRAANLRQFAVVKREGDMSGLTPDGKGGFLTPTPTNKAGLKLAPEHKAAMMQGLTSGIEKMMQCATAVKDAEEVPGAPFPPELGAAINDACVQMSKLAPTGAPAAAPAAAPPAPPAPPTVPGHPPVPEAQKSADEVTKAGRRMAANRLAVLQGAVGVLTSLLTELATPESASAAPAPEVAAAAPAVPTAEVAPASKATPPAPAPTPAPVAEATAKAAKLEAENAELRKRLVGSNSLDATDPLPRIVQEEPEWPMDMNRKKPAAWSEPRT